MSSQPVVAVENVSKCYHVYAKNIDRLKQALAFGQVQLYRSFWALENISFEVERGDSVGIVGANGSGKSTLLQILYGVLNPTTGKVRVSGKVVGLLELGAGFNPEETGRENVLINAAIMGIPADEIPSLYEKVVSFADIGDFIDQPVKVYSTGMAMRLGFALQISAPKDILIIDEALAVGDDLFQRRCYGALERFKDDGGTILFVSHASSVVKQLCRKAIFLDHGRIVQQGSCNIVVENYLKFLYMVDPERTRFKNQLLQGGVAREFADPPSAVHGGTAQAMMQAPQMSPGHIGARDQGIDRNPASAEWEDGLVSQTAMHYQPIGAEISDARIETLDGRVVNVLNRYERYCFRYRVIFSRPARNVIFGMMLKATSGLELGGGAHDSPDGYVKEVLPGAAFDVSFEFTACLLPGVYYFNCGVLGTCEEYVGFLHRIVDAAAFRIRNVYTRIYSGHVDFDYRTSCKLEPVESAKTKTEPIGIAM
jgi:lipopolysaccharide transport system ATP-binding protein